MNGHTGLPIVRAPNPSSPSSHVGLRTGAWYGDEILSVSLPSSWDVTVYRPTTGPPLTDTQILERLEAPAGQPPLRELCKGKKRPLVIVDDLNRPTPASRVLPALLAHFDEAGLRSRSIRILMA